MATSLASPDNSSCATPYHSKHDCEMGANPGVSNRKGLDRKISHPKIERRLTFHLNTHLHTS